MGESARRLCCFRWEVSTFIGVDGCEELFTGAIVRRFCGFIRWNRGFLIYTLGGDAVICGQDCAEFL